MNVVIEVANRDEAAVAQVHRDVPKELCQLKPPSHACGGLVAGQSSFKAAS